MANRQEEKERRRQERLAREREAAQAAQRKRLVGFGAGALLVAALVVVAVVVLASPGGSDDAGDASAQDRPGAIPERRGTGFDEAVRSSGCEFRDFPGGGREHSERPYDDYRTNPPTSGPHNPVPAEDGIYEPGNSPEKENWVHT